MVSKIHYFWLINGELQVLFECVHDKEINLEAAPVHLVKNKELVQVYLDWKHIPHMKKINLLSSNEQ